MYRDYFIDQDSFSYPLTSGRCNAAFTADVYTLHVGLLFFTEQFESRSEFSRKGPDGTKLSHTPSLYFRGCGVAFGFLWLSDCFVERFDERIGEIPNNTTCSNTYFCLHLHAWDEP